MAIFSEKSKAIEAGYAPDIYKDRRVSITEPQIGNLSLLRFAFFRVLIVTEGELAPGEAEEGGLGR